MLVADLVIGTYYRAFQQAPDVLNRVGMHDAAYPFLLLMVNRLVLRVVIGDAVIAVPLIRANHLRVVMGKLLDEAMQRLPISLQDSTHTDIAAPFDNACNNGFIGKIGPFPVSLSASLPPNVGFVYFDNSTELLRLRFRHGSADTMAEIPRRLIRNSESTLHLIRGNSLFGFNSQVDGDKPLSQRQVRIMEDRSRCHRELIAA